MNTHGVGQVSIMGEHPTTEGNGTTVTIPISEPRRMQEAAQTFFRAWKPGTVLVDGETPENFYDDPDALWLADDILLTRKGGITVVMGSVGYPLPSSAVYAVRERTYGGGAPYGGDPGLVVALPIGAVEHHPVPEEHPGHRALHPGCLHRPSGLTQSRPGQDRSRPGPGRHHPRVRQPPPALCRFPPEHPCLQLPHRPRLTPLPAR